MPYKRKQNGKVTWQGQVQWQGARKKKTFATKREAADWERRVKKRLANPSPRDATPTDSLLDWASWYLGYAERFTKKVFIEKRDELRRFLNHKMIDPTSSIAALTPAVVLAYCQEQFKARGGHATNQRVRKNLAAAYNHGIKYKNYPGPNPFLMVEKFPQEESQGHYVPPEKDFWKVYEVAQGQDRLLLVTLLYTAGRRSEIYRLKWEDVDFEGQQIALKTRKSGDSSWRTDWIPMLDCLAQMLKEHKTNAVGEYVFTQPNNGAHGRPYKTNRLFPKKLCERAGVKKFGCHGIRGLSATCMARAGAPMKAIQEVLRHSMLATTERYLRKSGLARQALDSLKGHFELLGEGAHQVLGRTP